MSESHTITITDPVTPVASATYAVSGNLTNNVPAAEVPALVAAMIAAIPADVKLVSGALPAITIMWLPNNPGMLSVAASLSGEMTQADIEAVLKALLVAEPDKATLQTGRVAFDLKT